MTSIIARVVNSLSRKSSAFDTKMLSAVFQTNMSNSTPVSNAARSLSCATLQHNNQLMALESKSLLTMMKNGYASLHTEGDRRFVELLQQEIEEEKQRSSELPAMTDGWKVSLSGAEGRLTRSQEGDKIDVSFNINGAVPPINDDEEMDVEGNEHIMCFPEFAVKITKSGGSDVVEFECYFPDDVQEGIVEDSMSMFSIRSAVIYSGEIQDDTYVIDTENLDPSVYSYFLSFLADRGVDTHFAKEFIQLTTAVEQQEYIRSLQKLKSFVSTK